MSARQSSSRKPGPGARLHGVLVSVSRQAECDIGRLASGDVEKLVHCVRVRMKKLHALLSLVSSCVAPAAMTAIRKDARLLKKAVATNRDQHVMEALLASLCPEAVSERKESSPAKPPSPRRVRQMKATARSLTMHLQQLRLQALTSAQVADEFAHCYANARRLYERCQRKPAARRLHRWRAPVKDHYFQSLILLRDQRRCGRVRKLGGLLGRIHDLVMLRERMSNGMSDDLLHEIDRRIKKLRRRALRRAGRLFVLKPSKLKQRV